MRWSEQVAAVTAAEGWSPAETDLLLDLAREVAHGTERRFAPLTAYAVGVAVGMRAADAAVAAEREPALLDLVERLLVAVEAQQPERP